jgi:hypothetical protein
MGVEKIKKGAAPAWPLALIAASAFVAIWAGWVGLGRMTGFGEVVLLPGIADDFVINSAITLPLGMEAYAAYALRVWLAPPAGLSQLARRYAACSALGALTLGAAGQVTYHLMQAAGLVVAPWQITTFVSCLPVAVLAAAAALYHLVRNGRALEQSAVESAPVDEVRQESSDNPTTPLPRAEAAAELPAGEISEHESDPAPDREHWAVQPVASDDEEYEAQELELGACDTKREQLLVAWKHLGVEVPETSDVMPALVWLAGHGVRMDKSGAYDIARKLRQKATSRPVQLAAVGGGR